MEVKRVRPKWFGHDMSGTLDSGIGRTQESFRPTFTQLVGRKHRADEQSLLGPGDGVPGNMEGIQWNAPQKRVLFGSDGPDSTSSGSNIQENRPGWTPDNVYADSTQYRQLSEENGRDEAWSPSIKLEQALLQLQKDLEEAQAESRFLCSRQPVSSAGAPNRPRFTSTPVPRYKGGSNWDQNREVFEAIVCSTRCLVPFGSGTAVALPGLMVHDLEGNFTGLR